MDSASSWSWVTKIVVMPSDSWSRRISSRSVSRTLASSADSGSSSSSTRGSQRERAGQRDALLLAAGHLVRVAVAVVGEADELQELGGAGAPLGGRHLAHPQPEGDVVAGVEVREEAVRLEDHARRRGGWPAPG